MKRLFHFTTIECCAAVAAIAQARQPVEATPSKAHFHYSFFSPTESGRSVNQKGVVPFVVGENGEPILCTTTNTTGKLPAADAKLVHVSAKQPTRMEMTVDPVTAHQYRLREAAGAVTLLRETTAQREERSDSARSGTAAPQNSLS
ncbi:MAG: hypothetical protein SFW62_07510 [Alphaproteobacteria bacterium]|nr:hypothetical protein [Alphaproteobacteria bacterium]